MIPITRIFTIFLSISLYSNLFSQCHIEQRTKENKTYYISNTINLGIELNAYTNTIITASLSLESKTFSILFYSTHSNLVQIKKNDIIAITLNDNSEINLNNLRDSKTETFSGNSRINWPLNTEAIIFKYQLFKIQDLGIKSIILANSRWNISKKANKQLAETIACFLELSDDEHFY